VTGLCPGEPDWRDLYIVSGPDRAAANSSGCIYRLKMPLAGRPAPWPASSLKSANDGNGRTARPLMNPILLY
jgi:hypothetical protein